MRVPTAATFPWVRFTAALGSVFVTLLAACGGDDSAGPSPSDEANDSGSTIGTDGGARPDSGKTGSADATSPTSTSDAASTTSADGAPGARTDAANGGAPDGKAPTTADAAAIPDATTPDAGTVGPARDAQAPDAGSVGPSHDAAASNDAATQADVATFMARDVCGATSSALAWTASIPASGSLTPVDIALGPTNDVVVADVSGGSTLEQHRWNSAGTSLSVHQDLAGTYVGAIIPSTIVVDPQNDLFYGYILTGLPQGANLGAALNFNRIDPTGAAVFAVSAGQASMPASAGAPAVTIFDVNFDTGTNTHSPVLMSGPQYFAADVYCWGPTGANIGESAANVLAGLTSQDSVWPASDGGLYLARSVTSSIDLGCGALAVPAAGAVVLGKFTGGGVCTWTEVLALPTAAVQSKAFRIGADGSLLLATVYSGTINFGPGALTSAGTNSLALARFDAGGNIVWAKSFGGAGSSFSLGSLGGNAAGDIVLTSKFGGSVNLGGGALAATGDTFVALFDQNGLNKWSRVVNVGSTGQLIGGVGPCGVSVATTSPSVDFGTGALSTASSIGVAALGL